jgi:hypothetical protein
VLIYGLFVEDMHKKLTDAEKNNPLEKTKYAYLSYKAALLISMGAVILLRRQVFCGRRNISTAVGRGTVRPS